MYCDKLITFNEEKKAYPPFKAILNKEDCKDIPSVRWYYSDSFKTLNKMDTIDTKEFRMDVLDKDSYSVLQHCCFQKEFFEKEEKFVYIGNITISESKRNLGITKKINKNQKVVYFNNGFSTILLDAFIGASFIWFRMGYSFVDNSHRIKIEKLLKDFLIEEKKYKVIDTIKINLKNIKSSELKGFRPYLEKNYKMRTYIPMFCKLKDTK